MNRSFWRLTLQRIFRGIAASIVLGLLAVLILIVIIDQQSTSSELRNVDALLVMGAAQWNGAPSPILKARLDEALRLYRSGYAPRIIVSGGIAPGDRQSEAEVARTYLIQQNIDPLAITTVAQGSDTYTTLRAVTAQSQADNVQTVLLVSDPAHLLRALKMAQDLGLQAYAAPVKANTPTGLTETLRTTFHEAWGYLGYILLGL